MRNVTAILLAVVVAAVCSQPLMAALQHLTVPRGEQLRALSAAEAFAALALFTLSVCGCAGLAVAAGCYLRHYSTGVRWTIALVPMLAAAFLSVSLKAVQFRDIVFLAEKLGLAPGVSLREASLYMVPAAAFVAGLVSVGVAVLLRRKDGRTDAPAHGSQLKR